MLKSYFRPIVIRNLICNVTSTQDPGFKLGIRTPDRLAVNIPIPGIYIAFVIPVKVIDVVGCI